MRTRTRFYYLSSGEDTVRRRRRFSRRSAPDTTFEGIPGKRGVNVIKAYSMETVCLKIALIVVVVVARRIFYFHGEQTKMI